MSGWIKIENTMPRHPKIIAAGPHASWLFLCMCCYSGELLTDGFIPTHVLSTLQPGMWRPMQRASKLVEVGLLHKVDGGWQIHDYAEYQQTAGEIRERRERDAERKRTKIRMESERSPNGKLVESARNPRVEVEVEVEEEEKQNRERLNTTVELRSTAREIADYWRVRCDHPGARATKGRLAKIEARLKEGYTEEQIRTGVDGAARAPYVNEQGKRFDDIELICRTGEKLEAFIERATMEPTTDSLRPLALRRADRWMEAYKND